ncbi:MAG: succinylglutamate desuccinylase/aspartoacylase family protein [Bryobacterales bacterium]|nr:succinylglutamate desuccinylase/aspartoacylase family protein [Bryobacterales bacterium]
MTRRRFRSFLFLLFALLILLPLAAQTRRAPRAKPSRAKAPATAPLSLASPPVQPGQSAPARFPAEDANGIAAHVFHGARPGPVAAFLFYGFTDEAAFHEAAEATFGAIPRASMQGTILVLSFPARPVCDGQKPCAPSADRAWRQLAPAILKASRFVIDVHQGAKGVGAEPYAFIYLPDKNPRLSTYVKAMARASLIPNVVELREAELEPLGLSAAALGHLAPQSLALNHPAISVEAPAIAGGAGEALRNGLRNLLDHLKMTAGSVSWQNRVNAHTLADLPPDFFAAKP